MSVADLLPEPLLDDEGMGQIALTLDAELARLDLRAPDLLGRLGTLSRPFLDAVARSFGVAFYPASISDDAVRDVIAGAVAWHRRRGTRWALAWALDVAGLGHAEEKVFAAHSGSNTFDFNVVDGGGVALAADHDGEAFI